MSKNKYYDFMKSIIAIVPKYTPGKPPKFPNILGTGFIVDKDGIVLTCDHVARAINNLYRKENSSDIPAVCLSFEYHYKKENKKTEITIGIKTLPIAEIFYLDNFRYKVPYAPPESIKPDIAFIQVESINLPALKLCSDYFNIIPGNDVFTLGFPLGNSFMVFKDINNNEWIQNFLPIIQKGIISSIFPFRCPYPFGYLVNLMAQEGSSGSPLFSYHSNDVIGIIDRRVYQNIDVSGSLNRIPTNFSYAFGLKMVHEILNLVKKDCNFKDISIFKDFNIFEEKSLEPDADFILYNYKP